VTGKELVEPCGYDEQMYCSVESEVADFLLILYPRERQPMPGRSRN
jgi:hypothetical protein